MGFPKLISTFLLLFIIVAFSHDYPKGGEARPLTLNEGNAKKLFGSLGVVCKCCDGTNGECTTSWESSCLKLQCHPWKSFN
ncbi:hypothetical protein M5689_001970 [Euphorbia peplus]|nr:hypothetical protein M5689_001970 [Euphorbia peplus]